LSLRGEFELGLLNMAGTIKTVGTLGDELTACALRDGQESFGSQGWNIMDCI
jgi:hypothetical protein